MKTPTHWALALPGDAWTPLQGSAWADTVGWFSFNYKSYGCLCTSTTPPYTQTQSCNGDGSCPSGYVYQPYWVAVDEVTGALDGYAWSNNVGWLAFRKTGFCGGDYKYPCEIVSDCATGSCDFSAANPPDTNFTSHCSGNAGSNVLACYDETERKFYGWARVLSLASGAIGLDAGWVKLDGTNYSLTVRPESDEAAAYDSQGSLLPKGAVGTPWGDLTGWGWGGRYCDPADPTICTIDGQSTGWLNFNCQSNNSCATGDYKVSGRPDNMSGISLERQDGNDSYEMFIDWSGGFPIYGASYYEVWRKNGVCSGKPNEDCDQVCNGGSQNGRVCLNNGDCPGGYCDPTRFCSDGSNCQMQDYQSRISNLNANSYNDSPLQFFITYSYIVRACNPFGCSRSAAASLRTSPIEPARNFKAVPICATDNDPPASFVDLSWSDAYIAYQSLNGVNLDHYQIQYRQLNPGETAADCTTGTWDNTVPNCDGNRTGTSCREILTAATGRYKSNNFYVYRLRAWGDRGTCVGGGNDGENCLSDADCTDGVCDIYKSSWACSNVTQVCPNPSAYQETRPQ